MSSEESFCWLHFSDIHVGMSGQESLWPRFEAVLLDDLGTALRKTAGIDLVIFSGDLVQRGLESEFVAFEEVISRIFERLGELGCYPKLITVPGNHDLYRPDPLAPEAMALAQFWKSNDLRARFWDDGCAKYRAFISNSFRSYNDWVNKSIERGLHVPPQRSGFFPGDNSYLIDTKAGKIGIIGLNSAWLQLGVGNYEGELCVSPKQLHAITGGNPDEWARQNDANLLVTHHPAHWLHADSPADWRNDLNPAGRFDLHLFGHMHEPDTLNSSHGGSLSQCHVQAASLFGLETFGDEHERIQGYSVNEIRINGAERVLTSWPRRLIKVAGGRAKLVPDSTQDIDEENGSFSVNYRVERRSLALVHSTESPPRPTSPNAQLSLPSFDLSAIQHHVGEARAHQKVRKLEQRACLTALREKRAAWLVSDWGMDKDGFIAALCTQLQVPNTRIYSINFSGYANRDSFYDDIRTRQGASFQQICEAIANNGPSILIFDDVEISTSAIGVESAIETLVAPICEFAAETYLLICSRRRPSSAEFPAVELKAFDEADVAIYARESAFGDERYAKPDAVSKLYRHTDGVPARIDDALRDLEFVSLDDLVSSNPDFGEAGANLVDAPAALIATVNELKQSDDKGEKRAYDLLLALSALPQGEQFARLKRFLGQHPFHSSHARALLERSLVDTVPLTALDGMPLDTTTKAIIVPRPVREYVRSITDEETSKSFDRMAIELYFGDGWISGNIARSPTGRRVRSALCQGYEIQNASTLILRSARRALSDKAQTEASKVIRLSSAFIEVLMDGDHFRSAAALSEDMIKLLEEFGGFEKEINFHKYEQARSLRMIGRRAEAKEAFEQLDHKMLSKEQRQSAELGLALNLEQSGDGPGAVEAAKRVIAIDRNTNAALQAKAIIASEIPEEKKREAELQKLLAVAKKKDSTVLANNIMIKLAEEAEESDESSAKFLKEVLENSDRTNDYYNGARAIVLLAENLSDDKMLSDNERARLIEAYHFLYNERLYGLFDRCHAALWNVFEEEDQTANLLNLFRHSSFMWRLRGQDEKEKKYLSKLIEKVRHLIDNGMTTANRDGAYFIVRASVVMGSSLSTSVGKPS